MKPRRTGNGRPGSLGLFVTQAATREVDEVAAIGRKVGTAFVNTSAKPLPELEFVRRTIPANGAYRVRGTSSEHQAERRF